MVDSYLIFNLGSSLKDKGFFVTLRLNSSCPYMLGNQILKIRSLSPKLTDRESHRVLIWGFYKGKLAQNEPKHQFSKFA